VRNLKRSPIFNKRFHFQISWPRQSKNKNTNLTHQVFKKLLKKLIWSPATRPPMPNTHMPSQSKIWCSMFSLKKEKSRNNKVLLALSKIFLDLVNPILFFLQTLYSVMGRWGRHNSFQQIYLKKLLCQSRL